MEIHSYLFRKIMEVSNFLKEVQKSCSWVTLNVIIAIGGVKPDLTVLELSQESESETETLRKKLV